jgi:hypothetical protein
MTTNNNSTQAELIAATQKVAAAHSAWLRSTVDLDALEQNDKRASAFAEYKRCQDEAFRISKMARLLQK